MSTTAEGPDIPPRPPLPERPLGAFTDRFDGMRRSPLVAAVVVVAVALLAGVAWYRFSVEKSAAAAGATEADASASPVATTPAVSTATATVPVQIVVHVAGAVRDPGVVTLGPDARVVEAIEVAGGPVDEADLDRLNLAARLSDGQRVLVARVGDPPTPALPDGDGPTAESGGSAAAPLDVNLASVAELEQLPGVGAVIAAAIVEERARIGAFTSVGQLRSVSGIGDAKLDQLRDLVTV